MDKENQKNLRVNISEIADAMESSFDGAHHYYLDTETGKVLLIQDEVLRAVEDNDREAIDDFPDWEKEFVDDAKAIVSDTKDRYLAIPTLESWEGFRHMEAFVETVRDTSLREKLEIALDGKGAFGRFKNALSSYPAEREGWFKFKSQMMAQEVQRWFISVGIENEEEAQMANRGED